MSGVAEGRSDAQGLGQKTALVFLIFAVAGPPIGGLIVRVAAWFLFSRAPQDSYDFSFYLDLMRNTLSASYFFGGLQALFVAIVAAISQVRARTGFVPLSPVLIASLLAGIMVAAVAQGHGVFDIATLFMALVFHALCGMLCGLICNALLWPFRPRPGNQATA